MSFINASCTVSELMTFQPFRVPITRYSRPFPFWGFLILPISSLNLWWGDTSLCQGFPLASIILFSAAAFSAPAFSERTAVYPSSLHFGNLSVPRLTLWKQEKGRMKDTFNIRIKIRSYKFSFWASLLVYQHLRYLIKVQRPAVKVFWEF